MLDLVRKSDEDGHKHSDGRSTAIIETVCNRSIHTAIIVHHKNLSKVLLTYFSSTETEITRLKEIRY